MRSHQAAWTLTVIGAIIYLLIVYAIQPAMEPEPVGDVGPPSLVPPAPDFIVPLTTETGFTPSGFGILPLTETGFRP